jgi:hypothetical protein
MAPNDVHKEFLADKGLTILLPVADDLEQN